MRACLKTGGVRILRTPFRVLREVSGEPERARVSWFKAFLLPALSPGTGKIDFATVFCALLWESEIFQQSAPSGRVRLRSSAMNVRMFVCGSAVALAAWLAVTYVSVVPVQHYPQLGRGSLPISAKRERAQAKPVVEIAGKDKVSLATAGR